MDRRLRHSIMLASRRETAGASHLNDLLTCTLAALCTAHSIAAESGQLHAGRQTRLAFQEENKTALRRANQKQMRQQNKF